ncbi:hypothetical protein MTO96_038642 [Rhipicephalus appendiculatus]
MLQRSRWALPQKSKGRTSGGTKTPICPKTGRVFLKREGRTFPLNQHPDTPSFWPWCDETGNEFRKNNVNVPSGTEWTASNVLQVDNRKGYYDTVGNHTQLIARNRSLQPTI